MVVVRPFICLSVRHGCTVAKQCKIGPRLLLITNRKSHTGFSNDIKINDLGSVIFNWGSTELKASASICQGFHSWPVKIT